MLTYRLPQFVDFLDMNYHALYKKYIGRLVELFPSFQVNDNNLLIVHRPNDRPEEDEIIMRLWKIFTAKNQ